MRVFPTPLIPLTAGPALAALLALAMPSPAIAQRAQRQARIQAVNTWAYQLQKVDVEAMVQADVDMLVIDFARDDLRPWSVETIERIKNGGPRKKLLLAYISIGEAESYRPYWRSQWKRQPPKWLGKMNPRWPQNFPVRFWDPDWQEILLGFDGYIDTILGQGFDGIYMDRVDVYQEWGPTGRGYRHEPESGRAMVKLVDAIGVHIRVLRQRDDFIMVAQNGASLAQHPEYLSVVDGIALENVLYKRGRQRSKKWTRGILDLLAPARTARMPVFAVDYLAARGARRRYVQRMRKLGLVGFAAPDQRLDRLN